VCFDPDVSEVGLTQGEKDTAMKQSEFEQRFNVYWREHYAAYDETGKDHQTLLKEWRERAHDNGRRTHLKLTLLEYARDCRVIDVSRKKKNLAQRIFDELGVDPRELEFDPFTRDLLKLPEETASNFPK
jgi:hypothetical protein